MFMETGTVQYQEYLLTLKMMPIKLQINLIIHFSKEDRI
ncbi:unnamed protein product [Paramecium octaurelia]|uniref:Uncharacterized protein n=1 Tax=Paramecium octaurelia TaxID=43137 RepID=A0A8S1VXX9_PAROT|nr:unnamed protein product [Paramecium octaurelia]